MDDRDENLLLRWSRRKHAARQGDPAPASEAAPVEPASEQPPALPEPVAEAEPAMAAPGEAPPEAAAVEDLPNIETLTYDSDYSVFMRDGVPEFLKKQALRKLWSSNPLLANLDGLNDYDPKTMNFLIQDMEGAVEAVAEVSRGLRDKIMDAKRERDDRPRGRRTPERRQKASAARPPEAQNAPPAVQQQEEDEAPPADDKRYDA